MIKLFKYEEIIEKAATRKEALKALEVAFDSDTMTAVINELAEVVEYCKHVGEVYKRHLDTEGKDLLPEVLRGAIGRVSYSAPYAETLLTALREIRDIVEAQ